MRFVDNFNSDFHLENVVPVGFHAANSASPSDIYVLEDKNEKKLYYAKIHIEPNKEKYTLSFGLEYEKSVYKITRQMLDDNVIPNLVKCVCILDHINFDELLEFVKKIGDGILPCIAFSIEQLRRDVTSGKIPIEKINYMNLYTHLLNKYDPFISIVYRYIFMIEIPCGPERLQTVGRKGMARFLDLLENCKKSCDDDNKITTPEELSNYILKLKEEEKLISLSKRLERNVEWMWYGALNRPSLFNHKIKKFPLKFRRHGEMEEFQVENLCFSMVITEAAKNQRSLRDIYIEEIENMASNETIHTKFTPVHANLLLQLVYAIHQLHNNKIVHQDMHWDNVLVDIGEEVVTHEYKGEEEKHILPPTKHTVKLFDFDRSIICDGQHVKDCRENKGLENKKFEKLGQYCDAFKPQVDWISLFININNRYIEVFGKPDHDLLTKTCELFFKAETTLDKIETCYFGDYAIESVLPEKQILTNCKTFFSPLLYIPNLYDQ